VNEKIMNKLKLAKVHMCEMITTAITKPKSKSGIGLARTR
jgi:hypothetical protein